MNQYKMSPVTESGLLTTLNVVLVLAAVYLPFIGILLMLVWPLPLIVLVVRHGLRRGMMAAVITGLFAAVFTGPMMALRLVLDFVPIGLLLGWAFVRNWSGVRALAFAIFVALVGQAASIGAFLLVTEINPLTLQANFIQLAGDSYLQLYEGLGVSEEALTQTREEIEQVVKTVTYLIPFVFILIGVLYGGIAYLSGRKLLKRLGYVVADFPPVHEWRLSLAFLYLFGFALVGLYWGGTRQIMWLYQLSLNANALAIFAGLFQGLVLVHCVFRHFRVSTALRLVFYVFILMNPFLAQVVAMTGLIDMIFDYRQRFAAHNRK